MKVLIKKDLQFLEEVTQKSGQQINLCFHCQKCASGCPIAEYAEYSPNQILRLIQMGLRKHALNSSVIWVCSGCETCGTRCPNGIKISEVFDALKELSVQEELVKEKNIQSFHQVFLSSVELNDRVQESAVMVEYKFKTGNLLSDIGVGWKMLVRGKLLLSQLSHDKKGNNCAKEIFAKIRDQ